ncbi:Thioredoxin reductase [Parapedobacter luteus]|uniref:Thioredoxin reductase n=1 Tax=Parapedobacter luteus TaxID=623280 RepID=A0A1T4ZY57_9SPHI|nr:NAD(P)/FAD-dependent oxidoreductase [Parapedobacter luteus]SKB27606.1 Thioredoxin reductase [Parapedobacter luteus]
MQQQSSFDAVIVGGSYAGLAAGMALGRSIRRVLIVDSGKPCNAQTPHSHNFLTQDGNTPAAIAAIGREQVLAYPTVQIVHDEVIDVSGENLSFQLKTATGKQIAARKIVFATGIKDQLPAIDGFSACWGISAIHCPYCHGYEYRNLSTGLLVNGEMAFEKSRLIHNWTKQLTVFTNGEPTIADDQVRQLTALGIAVVPTPVQRLVHTSGHIEHIVLADGSTYALKALYAALPFVQHSTLLEQLGCELLDSGHVKVDGFQRTTVPGIYAAGDNAVKMRSVASAVAAGTTAGAFVNHELISEGL